MSSSPSIPRSKRQTTAAAALTAAALAALAWSCAAPAAQAAGGRGADAGIPGSTAGTLTTRGGARPAATVSNSSAGRATPGGSDAPKLQRNLRRLGKRPGPIGAMPAAGVLRWGAGYATLGGSEAVRRLQRDLRTLGERPGPIDGLYGPLTQAAVVRFQSTRGLTVDGVVGLQTERSLVKGLVARRLRLVAERSTLVAPRLRLMAWRSKSRAIASAERARGAPDHPGSPATEPGPAPAPAERSSGALSPEWGALIAGLAVALLVTALWALSSRRRGAGPGRDAGARLNVGLAFACLLAVFAMGASGGALFASQAVPRARTEAKADPLFSGSRGALAARRLSEQSLARPRPLLPRDRLGPEGSARVRDLRPLKRLDDPQLR
jgi:peptidoglycan hydrolase-like protein with peptidoglycan-binding domain